MPYDYGSVMHYRTIAFSKNGRSMTIIPRDLAALGRMGQRIRFSRVDIAKLNRLYNCPVNYYKGDDVVNKPSVIAGVKKGGLDVDNELNAISSSALADNIINDSQKVYNFITKELSLPLSSNSEKTNSTEEQLHTRAPQSSGTVTNNSRDTVNLTTHTPQTVSTR